MSLGLAHRFGAGSIVRSFLGWVFPGNSDTFAPNIFSRHLLKKVLNVIKN